VTDQSHVPFHAHIYVSPGERPAAHALHEAFARLTGQGAQPQILFVGAMTGGKAGPHPMPQFEIHFLKRSLDSVVAAIRSSGLRALVHPLTDNDLADHTVTAQWIGEPLDLDLATLDPPGINRGVARFGRSDF
jgi:aromatic ring-cleaving dioxygenase